MAKQPYNVLFISVDDMNDWPSPFGGHPQEIPPNIEKLAQQGFVFNRAYMPNKGATAKLTFPLNLTVFTQSAFAMKIKFDQAKAFLRGQYNSVPLLLSMVMSHRQRKFILTQRPTGKKLDLILT